MIAFRVYETYSMAGIISWLSWLASASLHFPPSLP